MEPATIYYDPPDPRTGSCPSDCGFYQSAFRGAAYGRCRGIFSGGFDNSDRYLGEFQPTTVAGRFEQTTMVPHGYGVYETAGMTYAGLYADGVRHGHTVARQARGGIVFNLFDRGATVQHEFEGRPDPCQAADARFRELKTAALAAEVRPPRVVRTNSAHKVFVVLRGRRGPWRSSVRWRCGRLPRPRAVPWLMYAGNGQDGHGMLTH